MPGWPTLEASRRKGLPAFIAGHYPFFLKNTDEPEEYWNLPPAKRRELLDQFAQLNVVAVLGGHKHSLFINSYQGIQLINGESTSKNFDKRPEGFRLWTVDDVRHCRHAFISLEDFPGRTPPPPVSTGDKL